MKKDTLLKSYLQIIASAILFGFLIFGGGVMRANGFSLIETIVMPAMMVVILLFWFIRKDIKNFYKVPVWVSVAYLLFNIVGHFSQYAPLFFGVSVSLTLFLIYTQPIWTILISTLFLKEKFTKYDALIAIVIVTGLAFLLAPWQNISYSFIGVVFGLIAGIEMSAWIIFTAHFSKIKIKPLTTTFMINFYAFVPLIILLPFISKIFPNPQISAFSFDKPWWVMLCVLLFAIIVCIGARWLFCLGAKRISNVHLGLLTLLEPVVGTGLDVVFLKSPLSWNIVVGGAFILMANALLILKTAAAPQE